MGKNTSDAIDIVVGLASAHSNKGQPDKDVAVNPNFFSDAARVYITQKGHVDRYFGITKGNYYEENNKLNFHQNSFYLMSKVYLQESKTKSCR